MEERNNNFKPNGTKIPSILSPSFQFPEIVPREVILGDYEASRKLIQHKMMEKKRNRNKTLREQYRNANRIHNCTLTMEDVWRSLQTHFGENVSHQRLIEIALKLTELTGLTLDRDSKRRKCILICWFCENWLIVQKYLSHPFVTGLAKHQQQLQKYPSVVQQPIVRIFVQPNRSNTRNV